MVTRRPDWRARLARYLAEQAHVPHEYGRSDCALTAAGALEAMTGVDLAAEWRGRYTTKRGGLRLIRRAGYPSLEALIDAHLERRPPGGVRIGDIVQVRDASGETGYGVAVGGGVRVRTPDGLGTAPLDQVTVAWAVG